MRVFRRLFRLSKLAYAKAYVKELRFAPAPTSRFTAPETVLKAIPSACAVLPTSTIGLASRQSNTRLEFCPLFQFSTRT